MKIPALLILGFGHLITDLSPGILPALMPFLKASFGLTYTQAGIVVVFSNISSSIIQPFFGIWSDKRPNRWVLPVGTLVAGIGIAIVGISPNFAILLLGVLLCGVGVAAYHPEASKAAHQVSGQRKGSSMAIFSVGGNVGVSLAPIFTGLFISQFGLPGTLSMLPIAGLTAILLWASIPLFRPGLTAGKAVTGQLGSEKTRSNNWAGIALISAVVIMRSFTGSGMTYYIPFYHITYLQGDPGFANTLLFLYLAGGAVGTLTGGWAADRWGVKATIVSSLALQIPLIYLFRQLSGVPLMFVTALSGAVLISTFALTIVMGQELLPNNIGLASGLMTGFNIGMGGIGVTLLGYIADHFGDAPAALAAINLLPLIGLSLALMLPRDKQRRSMAGLEAAKPASS